MKQIVSLVVAILLIINSNCLFAAAEETPNPEIKNVSIIQDEVLPGEELKIEGEYSFANITSNPYHRIARLKNAETSETLDINLNIDGSKFYGYKMITGPTSCGRWEIEYIYLEDNNGKGTYFYKSSTGDLLNDTFIIPCEKGDRTPPEIKEVSILQDTVQPGDQLDVELEAADLESGLITGAYHAPSIYLMPKNRRESNTISIPLSYNPETGKYEGNIAIPGDAYHGEWEIYGVYLSDNAGNEKTYYKDNELEGLSDTFQIKPVFTGTENMVLKVGTPFDPLEGVKAESTIEGNLTNKITYKGSVNTNQQGIYVLKYEATGNNSSTIYKYYRIIYVTETEDTHQLDKTEPVIFHSDILVTNPEQSNLYNRVIVTKDGREINPTPRSNDPFGIETEGQYSVGFNGEYVYREYNDFNIDKTVPEIMYQYNKATKEMIVQVSDASKVVTKWLPGEREAEEFTDAGTVFINRFKVSDEGFYTISARDQAGNQSVLPINVGEVIARTVTNVTAVTDKESGQKAGTPIRITVSSEGNAEPEYRFFIRDTKGNLTTLQEYGPSDSVTWTPSSPGTYTIIVHAKDKYKLGLNYFYESRTEIPYKIIDNKVEKVSVNSDRTSPQIAGGSVTFTAASEGSNNTEYRFFVRDGKGNLTTLQEYSESNTLTWSPTQPGNYTIIVHAKDKSKSGANYYYEARTEMPYQVLQGRVTAVSAAVNPESELSVGSSISITATSEGSNNPEYRFFVRDGKGNLTLLQDYNENSAITWAPMIPGNYTIIVHAKDQNKLGTNYFYEARNDLKLLIE